MRTRTITALASCVALTVAAALTSQAQETATKSKDELARELVEVLGGERTAEQVLVLLEEQIQNQPGVPPGFLEGMREVARPNALVERLVQVYARELDAETIDAAIAFYETPAGRKLAQAQPALTLGSQRAIQAWSQETVRATLRAQGMGDPMENLKKARLQGNEAAALGALKTLGTSQALFREGDKDGDGNLQYAPDLEALGKANLIDAVLASGEKQGYRFELCHSTTTSEFLWMAVASPAKPGETGQRHFVVNHEGVIYYREDGPFTLDRTECKIPAGATPVGR